MEYRDCNTPTYFSTIQLECWLSFELVTFKRDYVYESCLDNAQTVLQQITQWVKWIQHFCPSFFH